MGRLAHNKSMRVTYHHDERVDVAGTGFTVLDRVYADGGVAGEALGGSCGNVLVSLALLHRHVAPLLATGMDRSEARRVGTECVRTCRYLWWPYHLKNKPDDYTNSNNNLYHVPTTNKHND